MFQSVKILFLTIVVITIAKSADAAQKCQKKPHHDSFVCVCTEKRCDTIDPLKRTDNDVIQIYESTRAGKRFARRIQKFGYNVKVLYAENRNLTIDRKQKFQEIIGFGGSFSDAASLGIGSLSKKLQHQVLSAYYGKKGIEYSVGRVVIAGSDFSNRPYTYDESPWDWNLVNYSFVEEDTKYKIPQLLLAQELSNIKLKYFASSWAPPAWLKTNNKLNHGGGLHEAPGSIFYKTYAKYLLKFFDGYKAAGIDWWGMTIQNEPATGFDPWFPWNTCAFSPETERDFLKKDLGPTMEAAGYTPENFNIMVLDHNRNLLPAWADKIFKDPEASRYAKGTGVHWYGNAVSSVKIYDDLHALHPDKFIFATEACTSGPDGDRTGLGNWTIGEEYAHDILRDLKHWVTGWTDWNLVLDMVGGPNWVQNYQSAPIIVNAEKNEFYKNPSFYAMGHFSKFLPPKSVRIGILPEIIVNPDSDQFQAGAFERPDGGIVVIIINSRDANQLVTITDTERWTVKINVEPHSFNSLLYY
ncbi:unnamed protein product [Allacma fusca]|uniref:Glucosylceramidase n=1 Tax=Allacma fusca TaxID=39272 RepID=A0A8J2J704_9HEXA|nr:unnamed protein product [Allacma fusca]